MRFFTFLTNLTKIRFWLLAFIAPVLIFSFGDFENRNLYHPDLTAYPNEPLTAVTDAALRQKIEEVYFKAADGVGLNAWYVAPQPGKPTVVSAHGNGGNLGDRWQVMRRFVQEGYGFLAFDYRGYGKSEGTPTERGLYRDMEAASRFLAHEKQIPPLRQIALGGSLGSAVVTDVATRISFRAVILFAAMTSAPEVAAHLRDRQNLPVLDIIPFRTLMRQHFDSLAKIDRLEVPLIIMHGDRDAMMPVSMPQALFAKAGSDYKRLLIIPGAGHNDVFFAGDDRLMAELEKLLTEAGNNR